MKRFIAIFLVFIICFTVCACQKKNNVETGSSESISSQAEDSSITNQNIQPTEKNISETETSTKILSIRPAEKSSLSSKETATSKKQTSTRLHTYPSSIDGYVTKSAADVIENETEPKIKYVLTDITSNLSNGIALYGVKADVDSYSGAYIYLNFGCSGDNKYFYTDEYTMQKHVDGGWVDTEQIREHSDSKIYELNGKVRYSHVTYLPLNKYFNNPENGRYKIKLNICIDEEMKIPADFEIEFTISKQTVERAPMSKKIENPVCAGFSLATSGMDYYYSCFSQEKINKAAELYNRMKLTPVEKIKNTSANYYTLSITDSKGYEYLIIINDSGNYIYTNGNYYYAESGNELYDYIEEIYMSYR